MSEVPLCGVRLSGYPGRDVTFFDKNEKGLQSRVLGSLLSVRWVRPAKHAGLRLGSNPELGSTRVPRP